jgi:hypothetical protein
VKHPGSVDLITIKQNKLPSFIDRFDWADEFKRFHLGPFALAQQTNKHLRE